MQSPRFISILVLNNVVLKPQNYRFWVSPKPKASDWSGDIEDYITKTMCKNEP